MAHDTYGNKVLITTLDETSVALDNTEKNKSTSKGERSCRTLHLVACSWRRVWHSRFSGWRGGALVSVILCGFVLFVNILLLIIAAAAWSPHGGIATVFTGDCEVAARKLTVAHLFINLLSSALLEASNYCMQRLVAPTRGEIDAAHARKEVLDIGIPSVRNLSLIAPPRAFLWLLLGLSSIPLHFVYNSVIFGTISANVVTFAYTESLQAMDSLSQDIWNDTLYTNISSTECNQRYSAWLFSTYGSGWALLNATDDGRVNQTWSENITGFGSFDLRGPYLYCISEKVQPRCQIQLSLTIMGVVIVSNIIKVIIISVMLRFLDNHTIVTIGDAIQSFLREPDTTTQDNCLLSMTNIRSQWHSTIAFPVQRWSQFYRPFWYMSCSPRRRVVAIFLALVAVIPATILTIYSHSCAGPAPNRNGTLLVLVVNSPQVIISFLYLLYNGLFTCMLVGQEWSQYAVKRATLRVTFPTAQQRSTHFLQLPYTWSIPLLITSILLHWTTSQAIFLARIAFYKDGQPTQVDLNTVQDFPKNETNHSVENTKANALPVDSFDNPERWANIFNGVGYSDMALLTSLSIVLALIVACRLIAGLRTYDRGLPVGGTVISAACHIMYTDSKREGDSVDIVEKPLTWGVTIRGTPETVGHLCFSDREVEEPELNCLYAGTGTVPGLKVWCPVASSKAAKRTAK